MIKISIAHTNQHVRRLAYLAIALLVAVAGLLPLMITRYASAAQMTSRSLTLSQGVPSASSQTYTYGFTTITTAAVQSIEFEACTTAVGTCTGPTGLTINAGTEASRSGWTNATTFTRNAAAAGGCTPAANVLRLDRTQAASETAGARTLGWNTQTNPSTANTAFFVRLTLYSDTACATPTDTGTVASAVVQTLTVNAAVAEVLNFCTGTTTTNDATGDVTAAGGGNDDCTGVDGTSINIGTLDTSAVNISPVSTNGGDSRVALAMLRTNAINGANVYYEAIQQSGTAHLGTLRISGATCDGGTTSTDSCINAAGTSQIAFVASTEQFGMTIAGINCEASTSYGCTFSTGTYNLKRDTQYDGLGSDTYGSSIGTGFAWDETGTSDLIASTTGATKVVDDEVLMMHFAATPAITTPFGLYTAQADFIAVATY